MSNRTQMVQMVQMKRRLRKGEIVNVYLLETGIRAQPGELIKNVDDQEWLVRLESGRQVYLSEGALWGIENAKS